MSTTYILDCVYGAYDTRFECPKCKDVLCRNNRPGAQRCISCGVAAEVVLPENQSAYVVIYELDDEADRVRYVTAKMLEGV